MNAADNISVSDLTSQSLFGLFELDSTGKVLYSKVECDGIFGSRRAGLTGLNFYDEVLTFKNVGEFRRHLDQFTNCGDSVENFKFTCRFDDGCEEVKVKLVRVSERKFDGQTRLTIVDIRKV